MKVFFRKLIKSEPHAAEKNQAVLDYLASLNFPPPAIRKALLELNQVRIRTFINGVPSSMVYQTVQGRRKDRRVMAAVADRLGLQVEDLFP